MRLNPWPQRFGWIGLGLGILCLLAFFIYGLATPLTYFATLRFNLNAPDERPFPSLTQKIENDFASRVAAYNPSVKLTRIPLTRLFEIQGSGETPEAAARQANDAYAALKAGPWGSGYELMNPADPSSRYSRPNRPGALILGLLGFMGLGLPGLWLIASARRTSAPRLAGAVVNPWPKRIFVAVLALLVLPAGLLIVGLVLPRLMMMKRAAARPLPLATAVVNEPLPPAAVAGPNLLFRPSERIASDSQLRLRWELRSPQPASVRLSLGRQSTEIPLYHHGVGDFRETVTVQFERQNDGGAAVQLTVMAGDVTEGRLFSVAQAGEPHELLAKANELVAGELALKFNTPVWIAFFGNAQVVLEVIPAAPVAEPPPPK